MIFLDTETFNEVPIKNGTYAYTSTCEPMVVAYAIDEGEVSCWDRVSSPRMPGDLEYLLRDSDDLITAHFAMFDRNVIKYGLGIDVPISRWRCALTQALAHALPGGLELLCQVLGVDLDKAKLKTGKALMRLFCTPRPKNMKLRRATPQTHPAEWKEFLKYATYDVISMREVKRKLPSWNYQGEELALYLPDQKINDRGYLIDTELATAAIRAVEREQASLAGRTGILTDDVVASTTQRDQLLAHILNEYGIDLPDMQMSTIERRIEDQSLPPELRELLAIRLQASSTSTAKYKRLMKAVMPDGRLRGTLQFAGAGRTRRWAGRTFQPQNLPSKGLPPYVVVDAGIEAMKGDYEDLVYENPMQVASWALRGSVIAPPGRKLVISDLANIEGRDGAWLAGEGWKLDAFRAFDAGTGPDLYKLAYSKAFRISIEEVTKPQRQVGKIIELFTQYGGGVGAYVTGALTYGVDLEELAKTAWDTLPGEIVHDAEGFLKWTIKQRRPTYGLSDKAFVTCDALKRMGRRAIPATVTLWKELEDATIRAINRPGVKIDCRMFKLQRVGAWLKILLPSGRYLCYPQPRVDGDGQITYTGINQYSRKWCRLKTYGGKLFENACQALAGDVLKANMPRIEEAGYETVLTVHDEILTETPDLLEFNAKHLSSLLATVPAWAQGMPLAAAGFEATRYRKE